MTEKLHYTLRFPNLRQNIVDVEAYIPTTDNLGQ